LWRHSSTESGVGSQAPEESSQPPSGDRIRRLTSTGFGCQAWVPNLRLKLLVRWTTSWRSWRSSVIRNGAFEWPGPGAGALGLQSGDQTARMAMYGLPDSAIVPSGLAAARRVCQSSVRPFLVTAWIEWAQTLKACGERMSR